MYNLQQIIYVNLALFSYPTTKANVNIDHAKMGYFPVYKKKMFKEKFDDVTKEGTTNFIRKIAKKERKTSKLLIKDIIFNEYLFTKSEILKLVFNSCLFALL